MPSESVDSDVSKAIDKAAGIKRKVVGSKMGLPGYSLKANDTDQHERTSYGQYTGEAAVDEGFSAILIEQEPEYCATIRCRLALWLTPLPLTYIHTQLTSRQG